MSVICAIKCLKISILINNFVFSNRCHCIFSIHLHDVVCFLSRKLAKIWKGMGTSEMIDPIILCANVLKKKNLERVVTDANIFGNPLTHS